MIFVLSPSKTLDFTTSWPEENFTLPLFQTQIAEIVSKLRKKSPASLMKMMHISEKLATLNHQRYQDFADKFTTKNSKSAIYAFIGDVYRDIHPQEYSPAQIQFAQKHLRIFSGLYGMLRPLDLIQPYRLEMKYQTKYWQKTLTAKMNEELTAEGSKILINLASNEYFSPIESKKIDGKIITPVFQQIREGKPKTIALFSKIARGTMANFIIKNQLENPEELKKFSDDGYKFDAGRSTDHTFYFIRNS